MSNVENGSSEIKNTEPQDLKWEPEHGLNHIPDDILNRAIELLDNDLMADVNIIEPEEGSSEKPKVKIEYYFSACKNGTYRDNIKRIDKTNSLTRNLTDPLQTCTECSCGEIRCIPNVAGFIKYSKENGTFEALMEERKKYREEHDNQDENLLFSWNPKDAERLKHLPQYMYNLADELINKGFVAIRPYTNSKGKIIIDLKKIGQCAIENSDKKKVGSINAGPHDIKRLLSFIKDYPTKLPDCWNFNTKSNLCLTGVASCQCKTNICPYSVAAYFLYLKHKGQGDLIEEGKKYSLEHPDEVYYGSDEFDFNFDDSKLEKIKQSIASAPSDILSAAFKLIDDGDAFLGLSKVKQDSDGKLYYRVQFSKNIKDGASISECLNSEYEEGDSGSTWFNVGDLSDYTDITVKYRLIRLIASIDYCRRKNIDLTDTLNRREQDIAKIQEMAEEIPGLNRVYSFVKSDKASSLSCIIQGDKGSGKGPIIESIADILSQNGKISTSMYKEMTLQQLSEVLTKHKRENGQFDSLTSGYEFAFLEKNKLYVLTGLDEFLLYNGMYGKDKGYMTTSTALRHVINVLGTFSKNTYVIIVSLSEASTEAFLELNKKYKYTFGQSIISIKNKPATDLYQEYMADLSEGIKEQIKNEKKYRKRFLEFIALNERFLLFANSALSHYLAEYSNVEGAPVLPPDVYDKRAVENSLNDMIGMQAVKEQLEAFESYITFQKKAKASGIEVKQGNLHMQFLGNPGTGKTTIARIVAKMLYDIGILEENKVVEVERKDLIAQYTGQTAVKTSEKIKEAMGGVLFVDEAYSLYLSDHDTFGKEAIATLIKAMEDYKDKFIVIFAGYDKEMQDFLKANSGIESRIGYTFHFEDYTASELTEIFKRSMISQKFELGDGVLKLVNDICDYYRRRKNFGNGRFVKKIEQQTIIKHANNMDDEGWDIQKITINDIPDIKDLGTQTSGGQENEISLDEIVGMSGVKDQIKRFQNKIKFEQKAKAAGAKIKRGNSHMLFLGNPGTGKTTIARIITKELFEAGVILENKLIEVERKDLVGQYLGQTAPKTSDVIDRAIGGVLFIDEAYSLVNINTGTSDAFGMEAIATIIKAMEDHKDEFVVIFAGYEREMSYFLEANSGIASRIGYTFTFEDYTAEELTEIFKRKMDNNFMSYTDEAIEKVQSVMQYFVSVPNFGNGRFAERVVNSAIEIHSERICESDEITDDLLKITVDDIPTVKYMLDHMPDGKNMINPERIRESQNERTAVHELGHALLVKLLTPDDSIERITISAEGSGALGYVRHTLDGIGNRTKRELENRICIKMAGLASEEVFLGEYGNGGTSDLESATTIATKMITRYGMSQNGFVYSKELDDAGKQEINDILKEQFDKAKECIEEYKEKMSEAKEYLLANSTISDEEFTRIVMES